MKCTLGRGHSHVDILVSCPGMSSGVKHAKSVQESYKFGISKWLGFMVEKNLTNSCFHSFQTLNFAYVAYIEWEVKSLSTFQIPKCWLEWCLPQGRLAPMINITSDVTDSGQVLRWRLWVPKLWGHSASENKCPRAGLLGSSMLLRPRIRADPNPGWPFPVTLAFFQMVGIRRNKFKKPGSQKKFFSVCGFCFCFFNKSNLCPMVEIFVNMSKLNRKLS